MRWDNGAAGEPVCCGDAIYGKAFIMRFVLDVSKPEKFQQMSENMATIDAHGYVIRHALFVVSFMRHAGILYNISAWGLRLLVLTFVGNLRASTRETSNDNDSHAFLYLLAILFPLHH